MATISLPRGRGIEVTATVNASLQQRVEISGPDMTVDWSGAGEGKRIGQTAIDFPPGSTAVELTLRLSYSPDGDSWLPSHETVTDESSAGRILVLAEDGTGALDGNDLVVAFKWVV
jgi:hypothetical protein